MCAAKGAMDRVFNSTCDSTTGRRYERYGGELFGDVPWQPLLDALEGMLADPS